MRLRLFNLAALVSLLLCVATLAMWVRSYVAADFVAYGSKPGAKFEQLWHSLRCARGVALYGRVRVHGRAWRQSEYYTVGFRYQRSAPPPTWTIPTVMRQDGYEWLGFGYRQRSDSDLFSIGIAVPHWFLSLASAALPAWYIVRRARRAGRPPGPAVTIFAPRPTAARNAARFQRAHREPPHNPPMQRVRREGTEKGTSRISATGADRPGC